jgi:hypothetical protein
LEHLVREIARELNINFDDLDSATERARLAERIREAAGGDVKLKLADTLIGPAVQKHLKEKAEEQGQILLAAIEEKLAGKRLIVFIDDLDRVRVEMVPTLLLTLREALDYPNYFYVMALAPDIVERGLRMVHEGWGEPRKFLEKIIELPKYLPEPTPQDRQRYAKALIESLGSKIDQTVLEDLAPFLPHNPRKLKLLLRYIASLHSVLNRFSASEVDWRELYLCLMLRFEFPEEIRALLQDEKAVASIEAYIPYSSEQQNLRYQNGSTEEKKEPPEVAHGPPEGFERTRFLDLCKALRERETLVTRRYSLAQLFNLSEQPPTLTFKEIEEKLAALASAPDSSRLSTLKPWLTAEGRLNSAKTKAFVNGLLALRGDQLAAIADSDIEEEVKEGLKPVSAITNILRLATVDSGGFKEGALTIEDWSNLLGQFSYWKHFETFDYHKQVREEESQLLKDIVGNISTETSLEILEQIESRIDDPFGRKSEAFDATIEEIKGNLQHKASDYILSCFEKPNGIDQFWAINFYSKGKNLLFTKDSFLHSHTPYRERLRDTSLRVSQDREIQRNFLNYFRMLCHGALETTSSFHLDKCEELLQDTELLKFVWTAAVAHPLNPRAAGSLHRYYEKLISKGISSDLLPKPRWWDQLAEMGFFSSTNGQPNS